MPDREPDEDELLAQLPASYPEEAKQAFLESLDDYMDEWTADVLKHLKETGALKKKQQ
jgi:hypothetical protein